MKPIRIYSSGIHRGEESLVLGNEDSGVINFSGCHLACRSCYTPETSRDHQGQDYDETLFVNLVENLLENGAKNINLISPTQWWNQLSKPLESIRAKYLNRFRLVIKISGYEPKELIKEMATLCDVFVPDFKVVSRTAAIRECLPVPYALVTASAISQMLVTHRQNVFSTDGHLSKGIVVRHLILPHSPGEARSVIHQLNDIDFRGFLNFMTHFWEPSSRKLHRADATFVNSLFDDAAALGIGVLIDGKSPLREIESKLNRTRGAS